MFGRSLPLFVAVVSACAAERTPGDVEVDPARAEGPLLGVAAGKDGADHACNVVLRTLARPAGKAGGFATRCTPSGCFFVWEGTLDVSPAAVAAGAKPQVIYQVGSDPTWWKATVTGSGEHRAVRIDDHTVTDGMSLTSLMRTKLRVAPLLEMSDGSRLFDHNRNVGDFDDYVLDATNTWTLNDDPSVCGLPSQATLQFGSDWKNTQHGALVAGGKVTVDYALARLLQCVDSRYQGSPAWGITGHARFLPSGTVVDGPLTEYGYAPGTGNVVNPHLWTLELPKGQERVEFWFETGGRTCSPHYDSDYGRNYPFAIQGAATKASVGWAGNLASMISRGCMESDRVSSVAEPLVFDSWVITRAVCKRIEADVWVPGITDASTQRPELVLAQVEVSRDGGAPETAWLDFVGRVGNDYRYRWNVAVDVVNQPWDTLSWSLRFSTDGNRWTKLGPRTIKRGADFCPTTWTGKC